MTIAQLIENLRGRDQSLLVMVQGYEGGYSTPILEEATVTLGCNTWSDYFGLHGEAGDEGVQAQALIFVRQSAQHEMRGSVR